MSARFGRGPGLVQLSRCKLHFKYSASRLHDQPFMNYNSNIKFLGRALTHLATLCFSAGTQFANGKWQMRNLIAHGKRICNVFPWYTRPAVKCNVWFSNSLPPSYWLLNFAETEVWSVSTAMYVTMLMYVHQDTGSNEMFPHDCSTVNARFISYFFRSLWNEAPKNWLSVIEKLIRARWMNGTGCGRRCFNEAGLAYGLMFYGRWCR